MSVHLGRLAQLDVLGLGLRNLQFGLQVFRLHHFGQNGPLRRPLSHLDIHFLQHARNSSADFQRVQLLVLELGKRAHLVNLGLLHRHLRGDGFGIHGDAIQFNLMACGHFPRLAL